MRQGKATPPVAFVPKGGRWPTTPLTASAPVVAECSRQFVVRLRAAVADIDSLSDREVASRLGFSRTALQRVLRGEGLPSLTMLATLEERLGADLWVGGAAVRSQLDRS